MATLGAVAFGTVAGVSARAAPGPARAASRRRVAAGLQLYTIRDAMRSDMGNALERVAAAGYGEVEFAGYFDRTPREVRVMIDDRGLGAPSAHVSFADITRDAARVLDTARAIGHRFVVVPSLPEQARATLDDWKRTAEAFNVAGAAARDAGLRFAFHNHAVELTAVGDVVPLQLLIDATDPDLVSFQLDVYWITRAGHDPVAWLRRHPTRVSMLHLKDSSGAPDHRMLDVGAGIIDFPALLDLAAVSGVQHSFVEHDDPPEPFPSIRASRRYLTSLEQER